jgi:hypothetical protein
MSFLLKRFSQFNNFVEKASGVQPDIVLLEADGFV